jgi:hypothetical protein
MTERRCGCSFNRGDNAEFLSAPALAHTAVNRDLHVSRACLRERLSDVRSKQRGFRDDV